MQIFYYPSVLTYVLDAQKNRLIETVLLSNHNICFGLEIRKLFFWYALLTKGLPVAYNHKTNKVIWLLDCHWNCSGNFTSFISEFDKFLEEHKERLETLDTKEDINRCRADSTGDRNR